MHGQRGFAKLVDAFHENHKKHSKKIIEFQIKRMTKYEKRGADPRVKYYLTPEMQEKYGVKVCVCELGITCLFIPYLSRSPSPALAPGSNPNAKCRHVCRRSEVTGAAHSWAKKGFARLVDEFHEKT